jgi:hypothetical protein
LNISISSANRAGSISLNICEKSAISAVVVLRDVWNTSGG